MRAYAAGPDGVRNQTHLREFESPADVQAFLASGNITGRADIDPLLAFAVAGTDGGTDHNRAFRGMKACAAGISGDRGGGGKDPAKIGAVEGMKAYAVAGNGTRAGSESNLPNARVKAYAATSSGPKEGASSVLPDVNVIAAGAAGTHKGEIREGNPVSAVRDVKAFAAGPAKQGVATTSGEVASLKAASEQEDDVQAVAAMGFGFELDVIAAAEQQTGYPHILISFVYDQDGDFFEKRLCYWPRTILGDSGAFTVWTKGETVDLDAYIAWCQHYLGQRSDFLPITLDVIPGQLGGGAPTDAERRVAMAQGIENSDALRDAGVPIMEVFHWHEPLDHLEFLLDRRRTGEVVGIGGLAGGGSITKKREFCDSVFATVKAYCGGDWTRTPPVHGLGISPESPLARRYPWFSIDSSSWATAAKFGRGVDSRGKRGDRDGRISNKAVRQLYLTRVLEGWNRKEHELTVMWHGRGIRFNLEGAATHA